VDVAALSADNFASPLSADAPAIDTQAIDAAIIDFAGIALGGPNAEDAVLANLTATPTESAVIAEVTAAPSDVNAVPSAPRTVTAPVAMTAPVTVTTLDFTHSFSLSVAWSMPMRRM
jgi:hypothetical protein